MKAYFFALVFFIGCLSFSACNKSEDDIPESGSIIGKWKLIETYMDPGDGSGQFRAVKSNKILEFDSTQVRTNEGALCTGESMVTYSLRKKDLSTSILTQIKFGECDFEYSYVISGNTLTIYYNCIEGCGERYTRIK